jgi:hypothetical protein
VQLSDYLSHLENPGIIAALVVMTPVIYKVIRILRADQSSDKISDEQANFRKVLLDQVKELNDKVDDLSKDKDILHAKLVRLESELKVLKLNMATLKKIIPFDKFDPTLADLIKSLLDLSNHSQIEEVD